MYATLREICNSSGNEYCNQIAAILRILTNHDVHCSVKKRTGSSDEMIVSLYRVNRSSENGRQPSTNYRYGDNTSLSNIIDEKESFFICNNLYEYDSEHGYKNKSHDWRKYYDAVLIVPIYDPWQPIRNERIWGFICADNYGGGFDVSQIDLISSFGTMFVQLDKIECEANNIAKIRLAASA